MHCCVCFRFDWSEYTIYWTYGCKAGLLDQYHVANHRGLKLYDSSGFAFGSFARWNPAPLFNNPRTVFGVMQSIGGTPAAQVNAKLAPFLQVPEGRR